MFRKVSFAVVTSLLMVGLGRMPGVLASLNKPLGHTHSGTVSMGFQSPSPVPDVGSTRDPAVLC